MKGRKMLKSLVFGLSLLLFAGCATVVSEEAQSELQKEMAKEQKMGEDMLESFQKKDFAGYTRYIPAGGRQVYSKADFDKEQRELLSRMGEIVSYRFLTRLEMEPVHQLVWAVRFKSYNLKGEPIFREALYCIVVGEVDESKRVFLFGFK